MILVARRDLASIDPRNRYVVSPNERFTVSDEEAKSLISRGLAFPYREPEERPKYAVYQTKDVRPEPGPVRPELKIEQKGGSKK